MPAMPPQGAGPSNQPPGAPPQSAGPGAPQPGSGPASPLQKAATDIMGGLQIFDKAMKSPQGQQVGPIAAKLLQATQSSFQQFIDELSKPPGQGGPGGAQKPPAGPMPENAGPKSTPAPSY